MPVAVAIQNQMRYCQNYSLCSKKIRFLSHLELQELLAGQTVGSGIIVDVSKHFTKIVTLIRKKNSYSTARRDSGRTEFIFKRTRIVFRPNTSNRCMIGGMVGTIRLVHIDTLWRYPR
jgi:hypothetical protein